MNDALQICRIYADSLSAVLETFGERPFTLRDLQEKGIQFPKNRTLSFFRVREVLRMRERGNPSTWEVSRSCRDYLRGRAA